MSEDAIYVGLDGGGTRVRALAVSPCGEVIGFGIGGPSNISANPEEIVEASIRDALTQAVGAGGFGRINRITAGMAGGGAPAMADRYAVILGHLGLHRHNVTTDAEVALGGACSGRPGAVLMAGTGSMAFGRTPDGRPVRAGGWGPLLGDEGSAAWIGRKAIQAVLRAADGRGPETSMAGPFMAHFSVSALESLKSEAAAGRLTPARLASAVPLVRCAADDGDGPAIRIIREAAIELAALIPPVWRRMGEPPGPWPIAKIGGLFDALPDLEQWVGEELARTVPEVVLTEPEMSPVQGASLLALREDRLNTPDAVRALSEWRPPVSAAGAGGRGVGVRGEGS